MLSTIFYIESRAGHERPAEGGSHPIATMPANLGYEEAAAVPYGGGEALEFLRKGNVRSGQRVLVNGAGGSFGTFAVQLAKVLGAHVTAVDSAPKLAMLRTIGADRVIDYAQSDPTNLCIGDGGLYVTLGRAGALIFVAQDAEPARLLF